MRKKRRSKRKGMRQKREMRNDNDKREELKWRIRKEKLRRRRGRKSK